ncbi:metallophosphatase [Chitinispirillum alkaliphilum]|nr:metallophosphatase [Chitinispirillum alkaliphilum]
MQAVISDIKKRSVNRIVCLGDIVGYYPNPQKCIELVRKHVDICVAGNHDYAAIEKIHTNNFSFYAFAAMEWTKRHISDKDKNFLASLPLTVEENGMFFTHSSPSNPRDWSYVFPDSEEAVFEAFNSLMYHLNFIGHTHWPSIMVKKEDRIVLSSDHSTWVKDCRAYLVNVGSVGQPRDFDRRSSYVLYDTETTKLSIMRVKYNYKITQKKIRECHLPLFLAERLEKGR